MSNETSTTETITFPKATPQTPPALVKKIGKTTYRDKECVLMAKNEFGMMLQFGCTEAEVALMCQTNLQALGCSIRKKCTENRHRARQPEKKFVGMKQKIGFLGLGTMGSAMCYGLFQKGFAMVLPTYCRAHDQSVKFTPLAPDENAKKTLYNEMLDNGCESADSQAELFAKSDFILLSMPTSKQVEGCVYGADGILANARPGTVVIDLTRADPASTRKLCRELEEKGIDPHVAAKVIGVGGGSSNAVTYKYPSLIFPGKGMNMPVDLMWKDIRLYAAADKEASVPRLYWRPYL